MKPISPQPLNPLDELLAAAVHGELTAAQRTEFDALLRHDAAARAAYQEIQTMHDLLENNHRDAKPDPNFDERMIAAVRGKVRDEKTKRESAWDSLLFLWRAIKSPFAGRPTYAFATLGVACIVAMGALMHSVQTVRGTFATINSQLQLAQGSPSLNFKDTNVPKARPESMTIVTPTLVPPSTVSSSHAGAAEGYAAPTGNSTVVFRSDDPSALTVDKALRRDFENAVVSAPSAAPASAVSTPLPPTTTDLATTPPSALSSSDSGGMREEADDLKKAKAANSADAVDMATPAETRPPEIAAINAPGVAKPSAVPAPSRKLVRDATLDLEVRQYSSTVDAITELAKADGGYLDSSNSQRGGNGKLQGTVVAKVAPDKLDAFLLKLHDLGTLKNQSISTEDVTKDYYDTQARLVNSRKMETQLQELLKHDTNKVADLLQVERELGRVRGEIEQMQGQLKLYDFQVQYATVTISVAEKDLNKTAAYLLQEHDNFALFVHDVEAAFTQARAAADEFKAQILNADLQHGSGNSMSATLAFSVPPDRVDAFLARVKSLGRVDNFTRTTSRVANDGGNSDEPADETRTDRDHAQVQLAIRADDESPRQQTQVTVASTGDIDTQAQALKDDAVKSGASVIASSFERAPDGTETAAINFRLPLAKVGDFMPMLEKLGRVEALTVSRNDRPGQAAADPSAPAEIDLRLHNVAAVSFENETPRQQTQITVASGGNVDAQAQQLKVDALKAGMAVTGSTFERQPDGTEQAALTFRLPLIQTWAFTDTLKKLGRVESLAIQRNDVPGPNSTDPNAPAEISLTLHSEPAVVAENRGVWPTLTHLFGGGVTAFLTSVETIGVLLAFIAPWAATALALAFVGRRVWVARRSHVNGNALSS